MQEDKTCQEQEPSVGVGGEGQSEGAGQVKGQYRLTRFKARFL